MDLEAYKRRLGTSSSSEALVNASIQQIKSMFKESPLFKTILLDGQSMGVRVNYEKENERELLLQPEESTSKGAIANFDGSNWLVAEFKSDIVYPKAKVVLCNQVIKWSDTTGSFEYPCITRGKTTYDLKEGKYMSLPEGDITVQLPYNSNTKSIKEGQRFIFADKAYEVVGVDNLSQVINGAGILQLTLERTSKSESDDTSTDVADNSTNTSGWGGGW